VYLFIIIFLSLVSLAPTGEKHYSKAYYANGNVRYEGWIQDSKKVNFWIFYHKNGEVEAKGHYVLNIRDKYWYTYSTNGSLKSEGHYLKGKKNKWWSYYNSNGEITHKCQLQNDVKEGYCLHFKGNEMVKASKYSEGKKQEEWTDYSLFTQENNLLDLR
jgi:antitoxin component YwqK of YwqJK toxin-antitoxin module